MTLDSLLVWENFLPIALNLVKVKILLVLAFFINKVGSLLIKKLAEREEQGALKGDLKKNLVLILKTTLQYGLVLLVAIVTLEIFAIDVLGPEQIRQGLTVLIKSAGIILIAHITLKLGKAFIDNVLNGDNTSSIIKETRRLTLNGLIKSILVYAVYFIASIMLLDTLGINTGSILAGVGVLGLAVSFGAQNLVRDIISGFFIIFEDQYNVGEYVIIAGITGTVIDLGLRTTQVQEWTGQIHTIPNGEISKVANFSRNEILAIVVMGIAYEEDIDKAIKVLTEAGQKASREIEDIKEDPLVQGVTELGDSHVGIRTVIKTTPGLQWSVEREVRKRFKQALDANGIEIPYPRKVVISK